MKTLLYISILTTIIVFSWLIFGFYHSKVTSTISRDKQIIITPIPPNFDEETVNRLRLRKFVEADLSTGKKIASGSSITISEEDLVPTSSETIPTEEPAPSL